MKKFKTGLLAFALIAGVSGAIVTKAASSPKKFEQLYNWVRYQPDGVTIAGTDSNKSIAQEQGLTNCTFSATRCAVGSAPGKPDVTLHYQN